ncbi:hypothetical protein D5S17_35495 [Pseudonocardiaceae bacterium YIM PH 21723]|nr:hypothetical protein D5S17_35495 [Pseudonocardiaceae bacterium YIM PH 21723]
MENDAVDRPGPGALTSGNAGEPDDGLRVCKLKSCTIRFAPKDRGRTREYCCPNHANQGRIDERVDERVEAEVARRLALAEPIRELVEIAAGAEALAPQFQALIDAYTELTGRLQAVDEGGLARAAAETGARERAVEAMNKAVADAEAAEAETERHKQAAELAEQDRGKAVADADRARAEAKKAVKDRNEATGRVDQLERDLADEKRMTREQRELIAQLNRDVAGANTEAHGAKLIADERQRRITQLTSDNRKLAAQLRGVKDALQRERNESTGRVNLVRRTVDKELKKQRDQHQRLQLEDAQQREQVRLRLEGLETERNNTQQQLKAQVQRITALAGADTDPTRNDLLALLIPADQP